MLNSNTGPIISDINEAVHVIETYKLAGLVWNFADCPLQEIKHYVPCGKEELVIVAHKNDKYLLFRLIFDQGYNEDGDAYRITLNFHENYFITIILSTQDEE